MHKDFTEFYRKTMHGGYNSVGPLYVDISKAEGYPDETKDGYYNVLMMHQSESNMIGTYKWMEERGEDIKKRPVEIEWRPHMTLHNNQCGIHIDTNAATNVAGLYVCGDMAGGGWRNSSAGGFVYGAWAGSNAAQYAKKKSHQKINEDQLAAERNRIVGPLSVDPRIGYSWMEVEDKARQIATEYGPPLTNDAKLELGLKHLERIRTRYLPMVYARDPREMIRAAETKSVFCVVESYLRAALFRKESRSNMATVLHKTEYPDRDDKNWMKHSVIRNVNGEMTLSTREPKRLKK
jgi:succinate dehydrogenase/fumarate reductase flavoprotein subunit